MHLNHISTQPPCLGCVNLVLNLCIWGDTQKTAVNRAVNMISAELNASAPDSQHLRAYEVQLPLPNAQANELPNSGNQS